MNTGEQDTTLEQWLDDMHPEISRFMNSLESAGWMDGFSRASLIALERYILDRWPDQESYLDEDDHEFTGGAVRYIGECLLRACGGGWHVDHDPEFVFTGRPFVRLDTDDKLPISPSNLITALLARRTGQVFSKLYDAQLRRVDVRRKGQPPGWSPRRDRVPGMAAVEWPEGAVTAAPVRQRYVVES